MEPKIKYECLSFGDNEEVGQYSKVVKYCEHVEEKQCIPSLKKLALRENKTTKFTFDKEKETKEIATSM
jgi:hypothetical protein